MGKITPTVLTNKILRYPERLLLDVPQFLASIPEGERYKFLMDTEHELERTGKLEMRRKFIIHFAAVVREQSKNSVKELTDFLFNAAPGQFREALSIEGKCKGAFRFLKLIDELIGSLENDKRPYHKKKKILQNVERERQEEIEVHQGVDKDVIKEWYKLFRALCKLIAPKVEGKKKHNIMGIKPPSKGDKIPSALREPKEIEYLIPFQKVAREVYIECLKTFFNIHI